MDLNNREIASLLLLGLLLVPALLIPGARSSAHSAISLLLHPKIVLSIFGLVTYLAAVVYLAESIGLWRTSLLKETLIWFLVSGLALFSNFDRVRRGERILGRTTAQVLIATLMIEFFMNLFALALWAEIAGQILLLGAMIWFAIVQRNPTKGRAVQRLEMFIALIGFSVAGYTIWQLIFRWAELDKGELLLELALPLWLTVALLPMILLMGAISAYESAFINIDSFTDDRRRRRRTKSALVLTYVRRIKQVGSFGQAWAREATEADSLAEARAAIRRYRDSFHA